MDKIINLLKENYIKIVYFSFLAPIIIVAIISISHVTQWYDISNPINWATYLSVGIEIAALSSLSAISADLGKKTYLPFIIVTFIQFIGNIVEYYTSQGKLLLKSLSKCLLQMIYTHLKFHLV
jgi:hypothetical protein